VIMTSNPNLSRTGAAFLLLALVSACGSSNGGPSTDAGNQSDSPINVIGAPGSPVNLRTAGGYVILAKSGISTVPTATVTGNMGVSPAAATYITQFSLTADSTNVFSTSAQVTGKIFASDYAAPTPSNLTTAISDMENAFADAAGRAPTVTELGAGNIGGMTLASGVYKWGTGLLIPTNVTLSGTATAVWIFQIAQDLTVSSAASILLTGGALPKNVFWQVGGGTSLGTTSHLEGVVLAQTSVTLTTGASIRGRLLAQTAVSIDGSTVVEPAP
jgi:Ice-binding-like